MKYLASPYTHADSLVRETRFEEVSFASHFLMVTKKWQVFSPIVYGHHFEVRYAPFSHEWWMEFCLQMLDKCDELIVFMLPGWDESKGIRQEMLYAHTRNIPIIFMDERRNFYNGDWEGKNLLPK